VVDFRHPLRHAIVVGVFGFEGKLQISSGRRSEEPRTISSDPAIRTETTEVRVAIRNQTQGNIIARQNRLRRAKHCAHEIVIQIWRPQGQLSLFESKQAVVMPRSLPKHGERKRMSLNQPSIGLAGSVNVRKKFGTKHSGSGRSRLKGPYPPEHLAAIVPRHSNRRDGGGPLVHIKIRRVA